MPYITLSKDHERASRHDQPFVFLFVLPGQVTWAVPPRLCGEEMIFSLKGSGESRCIRFLCLGKSSLFGALCSDSNIAGQR